MAAAKRNNFVYIFFFYRQIIMIHTALRNRNRTVFVEMAYRDEDSILDQIYLYKQMSKCYYDNFQFSYHYTKMHTNLVLALKSNYMSSLSRVLYFFKYAFS